VCVNIVAGMWDSINLENQLAGLPLQDQPPISRQALCSALAEANPDDDTCPNGGIDVPRVPGLGASFESYASLHANGCGDGSAAFQVANIFAGFQIAGYTGNPNEPLVGLNITHVCNAHDACFAGQAGFGECNVAFGIGLEATLQTQFVQGSTAYQNALSILNAYTAAVGLFGQDAYGRAGATYRCAAWNASMEANQCPR